VVAEPALKMESFAVVVKTATDALECDFGESAVIV